MAAGRTRAKGPPPANPRMAIQDWLNLVEPDGAFLTTTELLAAFPHGFEQMPPEHRTDLRARAADLDEDLASRVELRRWLLETALEWDDQFADGQRIPGTASVRVAEHGIHLAPGAVLLDVDDPNKVRVGVFVWPAGTRLDRRADTVIGDGWPTSPVQRAEIWCRESGVPLALVTDDDQWALVWAPRGLPAASCRWRIADVADERVLQNGLVSLLGARRFFAVADDETIERLFERAADAEAEITKGLGTSVRRSVELLVAAISRDDVASGGRVLEDIAPTEVYEASVSVLMRLVFLLFAEERRLLPAEDPLWAESYSVLTLRDNLRNTGIRDGEDALERRSTAWHRLLATFRAVHGGANHDRLLMPAYGGSLFDPDRFPFLEGRRPSDNLVVNGVDIGAVDDAPTGSGRPVALDDRTVLAILDALLNVKVRSGRSTVTQRVSYKALDVEQIGHCYEGLLDHGCADVEVLSLGLVGPEGGEPEIAVRDLEQHLTAGPDALCEWLSDKTRCSRSTAALAKDFARRPEGIDLARLRVACGHDDAVVERVLPFWGLIRADLRGLPVVLLPGSQFVTQTSTRRNTGAQYTTKALAEEVVRYALEPLVYDPGPQNETDPGKWQLRTPAEILDLRVCDPAVGSGAILTAAGRYLADRLIEAVAEYGPEEGRFGERLADLASAPPEEQTVLARREVVDHCLYGVDKNPVAAEMAKLSLWLTTMARERPFTFLDHAIQVGDSLLGITDLDQLRWLHLDPAKRHGKATFETLTLDLRLKEAGELARRLQELSVVTVRDAHDKQRLHEELRAKLADLSIVADTIVGAAFSTVAQRGVTMEQRLDTQLERIRTTLDDDRPSVERTAALKVLQGISTGWIRTDLPDQPPMPWDRQCLHWPLAFPEVFLDERRAGFDAMVANPPFLGGTRISGPFGVSYRSFLAIHNARAPTDRADLVTFFLLRGREILNGSGVLGTLATRAVTEGASRRIGLDRIAAEGRVYRASSDRPWPGESAVRVSVIWFTLRPWKGAVWLDGSRVAEIDGGLTPTRVRNDPAHRLRRSAESCFIGAKPMGDGFVLSHAEAVRLISIDNRLREVVRPYLSGDDVAASPTCSPSRWCIYFSDWPLTRCENYEAALRIVKERVLPQRLSSQNSESRLQECWWMFGRPARGVLERMSTLDRIICFPETSKVLLPLWASTDVVPSNTVVVVLDDTWSAFASLSSCFHRVWAIQQGTLLESRHRYMPSACFETFPQPRHDPALERSGVALDLHRAMLMKRNGQGLTATYNRVHDVDEHDPGIVRLRGLHMELDHAVRDAYGWSDLELDHRHWETPQGMRFTVSPAAKDELLDRLLELNHGRYAAEVAAGLHDKKKGKKATGKRPPGPSASQGSLL